MEKEVIKILVKAIVYYNDRILILRRSKDESLEGTWDFPGGKLNFLEEKIKSVKREIREETGLTLGGIKEIASTELIIKKKKKHYLITFFKIEARTNKIKLSKEHDSYLWIKPKEIFNYKLNPLIKLTKRFWKNETK